MKVALKGLLVALSSAMAFAVVARGEEVSATKQAPIKSILPGAHAGLEARHITWFKMNGDELSRTVPEAQARLSLGTKWLDDVVDTTLTLGMIKDPGLSYVTQRNPRLKTAITALSSTYVDINPYVDVYMPFAGYGSDSIVSLDTVLKAPQVVTTVATLDFSLEIEPTAEVGSRPLTTDKFTNKTGIDKLSLTSPDSSGTETVKQDDFNYGLSYELGVSVVPTMVKDLTVIVAANISRDFSPKYEIVEGVSGGERLDRVGYATDDTSRTKLELAYKVNDKLSIINDTAQRLDGFYSKGFSGYDGVRLESRWYNVLKLSYSVL